jgi:hypothetical protein
MQVSNWHPKHKSSLPIWLLHVHPLFQSFSSQSAVPLSSEAPNPDLNLDFSFSTNCLYLLVSSAHCGPTVNLESAHSLPHQPGLPLLNFTPTLLPRDPVWLAGADQHAGQAELHWGCLSLCQCARKVLEPRLKYKLWHLVIKKQVHSRAETFPAMAPKPLRPRKLA